MTTKDCHRPDGLTRQDAHARLIADGPNELPSAGGRSLLRIALEVLREPMLALLLAGGVAYLLLGDLTEALILLGFATFSVVVTVIQETRTEHVLEALRDLSAPRALVIRDGARVRIAGREVVRGDLLVLEQGDRIAADAVLIEADDLQTDESLLTGESLPVGKIAEHVWRRRCRRIGPAATASPMSIRARSSRGAAALRGCSRPGRAARSAGSASRWRRSTPKRRACAPRPRASSPGARSAAAASLCWSWLLYGLLRGGWIEAVLAGIAIGMSMLPEEFPVVLTVFLAMGAWRIGKVGVLTRRAAAIETLGSATVLCTDKTGTLTENRMSVAELWLPSGETATLAGDAAVSDRLSDRSSKRRCWPAPSSRPIRWRSRSMTRGRRAMQATPPGRTTLAHAYALAPRTAGDVECLGNVGDRLADRSQGRAGSHRQPVPSVCRCTGSA